MVVLHYYIFDMGHHIAIESQKHELGEGEL